jgi:hypothetical protein
MAGELGLANSFRERVYEPLQAYRGGEGSGGREIGLEKFMATRAVNADGKPVGLLNSAGTPVTLDDLWCDLGIDPATITLDNLLTMRDNMRYLAPEIIREFVLQGFNTDASYLDLVAGVESVDQMTVTTPWIGVTNETAVATGEVETIAEADLAWGEKHVKIHKKAKAFKASDELLLSVKLPVLSYFLRRFGVALSAALYTEGVGVLVNGDQADGSDAIATIGVADASKKIEFPDFVKAWIRGRRLAMKWDNMITSEAEAFKILSLDEFSAPAAYGPAFVTIDSTKRIMPSTLSHSLSEVPTLDQALLFDKSQAMIGLVFRPLLVENERIIMRQLNGTACSIIFGYTTILRYARILIDGDLAFAGNGFPSWMAPLV